MADANDGRIRPMTEVVKALTAGPPWRTDIEAGRHFLTADEGPALGGADAGPAPFDLVLAGLAACTGITLRMYGERKGWGPMAVRTRLELALGKERRLIRRTVEVEGAPDAAALERLKDIVERTPVTLALKGGFEIATTLVAAAPAPEAAAAGSQDRNLDEALEETFPASDPIAP
jgi:putative redox protein